MWGDGTMAEIQIAWLELMSVYCNPNNPKKCYVDRPISKSFTSMMFIIMGTVTILSSVLVFFLMQL